SQERSRWSRSTSAEHAQNPINIEDFIFSHSSYLDNKPEVKTPNVGMKVGMLWQRNELGQSSNGKENSTLGSHTKRQTASVTTSPERLPTGRTLERSLGPS